MVIGVCYFKPDGSQYEAWNEDVLNGITQEIKVVKARGQPYCLIGDFNGHIHERDGGSSGSGPTDRNGRRVLSLAGDFSLSILNFSTYCQGAWTWNRKNSKTIIDYILASDEMENDTNSLIIDEAANRLPTQKALMSVLCGSTIASNQEFSLV